MSSAESSLNLSIAGKGKSNEREGDNRPEALQQRSNNPVPTMTPTTDGLSQNKSASTHDKSSSDQADGISDVGSDLLEFGASVEFHEDHRRHIHAETLEIEASNEATREALSKEQRAEEQLTKDLGRSESELLSLNQGAQDQFESAKTFWTLTTNLRREFETRIAEVTKSSKNTSASASQAIPSEPNAFPSTVHHPVTPDGRSKEGINSGSESPSSNDENHSPPLSNKEILAQKASRAETALQAFKDEANAIEAINVEINALKEKQTQLEASMEFQGLQASLERAKEEEHRVQSEILQDRDTKATRIIEIQQLRESTGTNVQLCSDLAKELAKAKNSNHIEEANLRQKLERILAEAEDLRKKKEETMLKIEAEKRNIERVSNEMDNYHYYCKVREDNKRETALRCEQKKKLLACQAEAMRKLEEAQKKEKASLLRKQQAQEAMSEAESMKLANDENENKTVLPGKAELIKLSEQTMKLAEKIAEASKHAEKEQVNESEALAFKARAKDEGIALLEKFNAEYQAKLEEKETRIRTHQEFIRSHNEQIASSISQAEKFSQLRMTENEAYERRLADAKERWLEKFSRHVDEQKQIHEALVFKVEVIERGILLLQDAERVEREAQKNREH